MQNNESVGKLHISSQALPFSKKLAYKGLQMVAMRQFDLVLLFLVFTLMNQKVW